MTTGRASAAGALFGLATLAALVLTAGPIGVTWDEPIYSQAAERAASWLGMIARGDLAQAFDPYTFGISWGLVNEHPPLVRVLNGLGWAATRGLLPLPMAHRAGTMLLASVALGVLVGVAARQRGIWAALFAGAATFTMPRLFFHAHLGALDFPHAATWLLATLAFYTAFQNPRPWSPVLAGAGLGLALLTKINAVLLVPYWGLWLLLYRRSWRHLAGYALTLAVGLVVLSAGWPWIWKDPVTGLANWARFFQVHFEIRQWFAGRLYVQTPWYLPPAMIGITTPVPLLVLGLIGIFLKGKPQRANDIGQIAEDKLPTVTCDLPQGGALLRLVTCDWTGLHLLGLLTVLGYYMLSVTPIHDQERLLLPAFVHLAVLAGDGFVAICSTGAWFKRVIHAGRGATADEKNLLGPVSDRARPGARGGSVRRPATAPWAIFRTVAHAGSTVGSPCSPRHVPPATQHALCLALAALLLLPGLLGILRLHPFELSYYNELVGGLPGAQRLGMETTYFASTYGYFLPWLNRLPAGSKLWVIPNSWDVIYYYQRNGLLQGNLMVLRPPGWGSFYDDAGVPSAVGGLEDADYALIERRQTSFNDKLPQNAIQLQWAATRPELARLERDGVPLATLHKR
jgi:hypothetical protein